MTIFIVLISETTLLKLANSLVIILIICQISFTLIISFYPDKNMRLKWILKSLILLSPEARLLRVTPCRTCKKIKDRPKTTENILIFNDQTGQQIDLDLSGSEQEFQQRYAEPKKLKSWST